MANFPSPFEIFRALRAAAAKNERRVIAATLLPRSTWSGDGYDICWTGDIVTETDDRTSLTTWSYTARCSHHDENGVTVGLHTGRYDIGRTATGVMAALMASKCPGQWHMRNSLNEYVPVQSMGELMKWLDLYFQTNPAGEE